MRQGFTLPDLEIEMEALRVGQALRLAEADFLRLFGGNGAGRGRLVRFASGLDRAAVWTDAGLLLRKQAGRRP